MRFLIAFLTVLGLAVAGATLAPTVGAADSGYVLTLDQQPEQPPQQPPEQPGVQPGVVPPDVDIDIAERTVSGDWWANPVWIGVGIVALILLIVIVALATKGGGTTVVKD
jgi:hypothetical protein